MRAARCSCGQAIIVCALSCEFLDSVLLAVAAYDHLQVPKWTSAIIEGCIKSLTALNKPFKYVGKSTRRSELNRGAFCKHMYFKKKKKEKQAE